MNTDSMMLLFDVIFLAYGAYSLYVWFRLKKTGKMPEKCLLQSQGLPMDRCLDPEGYVEFLRPRVLVFGILLLAFGGFCIADTLYGLLNTWLAGMELLPQLLIASLVTWLLPLGILIWFAVSLRRIQNKLW